MMKSLHKILIFSIIAISFSLNGISQMNGIYTINKSGSGSRNYKTFKEALLALDSNGVNGAVIFRVTTDVYTEQLTMKAITGASAVNRITFESASLDNNSVVVEYNSGSAGSNYVINMNGACFITIRYLTIRSLSTVYGNVFDIINGSGNILIRNCKVLCNTMAGANSGGIISSTSTNENNITISNNLIQNGAYGVRLRGVSSTSTESGAVIDSNVFQNYTTGAINLTYLNGVMIRNNFIYTNTASISMTSISLVSNNNNYRIEKNTIYHGANNAQTYFTGISNTSSISKAASPGVIANNFIMQNGICASFTGITTSNSDSVYYLYNSVQVTSVISSSNCFIISGTTKAFLYNNNFSNLAGGYVITSYATNTGLISDYNNYHFTGGNIAYWGSTLITDLDNWKTTTGKDMNSFSISPSFYSFTDLHCYSSALSGKAKPSALVTDDIDGQKRNPALPDIGADEYNAIRLDAGITRLVSPTSVCGNDTVDVIVRLANFGVDTITSDSIIWEINGIAQPAVKMTGNIPPGGYQDVSLGKYSFSDGIVYTIKARSHKPNNSIDSLPENDTLSIYNFRTALRGNFTIGTGKDFSNFTEAAFALNNYGVCGNVVLTVYPGTYNEQITLKNIPGSGPFGHITFTGTSTDSTQAKIRFSSTGINDNWTVKLDQVSYITFRKISVENNGSTYAKAFVFDHSCSYVEILNCNIKVSAVASTYICPVFSETYHHNYLRIENNYIANGYYGIRISGASTVIPDTGLVIRNNIINDFYAIGTELQYQDFPVIDKNEMKSFLGAYTVIAIRLTYCKAGCRISNNKIAIRTNQTGNGITLTSISSKSVNPCLLFNNSVNILGPVNNSGTVQGISAASCSNMKLFHNTVRISTGTRTGTQPSAAINLNAPDTVTLQNNIFSNLAGGYAITLSLSYRKLSANYNDIYSSDSFLARRGTTIYKKLAPWKTATNMDSNSISIVPAYYDTLNLHLTNITNFRVKHPISLVTEDIEGIKRNKYQPLLGAYERAMLPYDITITRFAEPAATVCEGIQPVSVMLKNNGTNAIDTVEIHWKVDSVYMTPFLYTKKLTPDATASVTIGTFNFTASTPYELFAWTNIPGHPDSDPSNDTNFTSTYADPKPFLNLGKDTSFTGGSASITFDAGTGMDSYYWYDGSTGQTKKVDTSGGGFRKIIAWVRVKKGACIMTDSVTVTFKPSSIAEEPGLYFNLYPNPCKGIFYLETGLPSPASLEISVADITGKILKVMRCKNISTTTLMIDMQDHPAGIYLVILKTSSFSRVIRLSLEK